MTSSILSPLLYFYGIFLIACGITAVIFIGTKAKTALASGGMSGIISILIAYASPSYMNLATMAGIVLSFALFVVFAWRSTKTLFRIFELLRTASSEEELRGKGIAFMIISLMAIVSIFVFALQVVLKISG